MAQVYADRKSEDIHAYERIESSQAARSAQHRDPQSHTFDIDRLECLFYPCALSFTLHPLHKGNGSSLLMSRLASLDH